MSDSPVAPSLSAGEPSGPSSGKRWLGWSSFFVALIQSVCTGFVVLSGFRVLLGAAALASAAGAMQWLDNRIHIDVIRIPMMLFALLGSLLNLLALWQVRRLRARSASAWRQKQLTPSKRNSERLQFILSVVTLLLLTVELLYHIRFTGHA